MPGTFLPPPIPRDTSDPNQLIRWTGEVSAAGARSQFLGAMLSIIVLLVTLVIMVLAIRTLGSTNDQLKILNVQYKALLIAMKPSFTVDGLIRISCKNPQKNHYSIRIMNASDSLATDVCVNFIVQMKGRTEFEDLVSVLVKDFDPKQDKKLGNSEIAEQLNNSLRQKYVKALTEKDAISNICAYCIYKDRLGNQYNDRDLKNVGKIKLLYEESL